MKRSFKSGKSVLSAQLAGAWYTADPAELKRELQGYLDQADTVQQENVHALIQPHAGYRFSGPTAAYGARQVAGRSFSRVIVWLAAAQIMQTMPSSWQCQRIWS